MASGSAENASSEFRLHLANPGWQGVLCEPTQQSFDVAERPVLQISDDRRRDIEQSGQLLNGELPGSQEFGVLWTDGHLFPRKPLVQNHDLRRVLRSRIDIPESLHEMLEALLRELARDFQDSAWIRAILVKGIGKGLNA